MVDKLSYDADFNSFLQSGPFAASVTVAVRAATRLGSGNALPPHRDPLGYFTSLL